MKMTRLEWRRLARQAQDLIQTNRRIEAIKLLRARTDCGLSEAYHAMQQIAELPETHHWTEEEQQS